MTIPDNIIDKDIDTNIFETKTGALNLAPVKISGQYKIVVNQNNELFFDDYNGKRVLINKGQQFLPQLANFLKTKSIISDYNKLRYGGFSKQNTLSYHAPLYIGKNDLVPEYFIINNIGYGDKVTDVNNITDENNLGPISNLNKLIDLKKCGLHNIFNEILSNNNYTYPFYSDFENHKLIIYGFDYNKGSKTRKEISLLNNASNQTYFSSLNNSILNIFNDNNIVFPRFINIEFEFNESKIPNNLFGNYYGYYSYENIIKPIDFENLRKENRHGIFTKEFLDNNIISQKQTWNNKTEIYKNLLFNINSFDTQNKLPLARLKFNFLFDNDAIRIYDEYGNIFYEYVIKQDILKSSFRETLIEVSRRITKDSDNQIVCKLDSKLLNTLLFEINSNVTGLYFKPSVQINQYEFIDLFNTDLNPSQNSDSEEPTKLYFKEINDNTIIINNIFDTQNVNSINGDYIKFGNLDKYFKITEYFIYDGLLCCEVVSSELDIINLRNQNLLVQIYDEINTKLFYHKPLPFLNYINNDIIIESNEQFNKDLYLHELSIKFDTPEFLLAFNSFSKFKVQDNKQFIHKYESSDYLYNEYPNANKINVLDIKFGSYGFTSFMTQNLFNMDLSFYDTNSNVIYEQEDLDKIRFHWFLIKSKTPDYLNSNNYHFSKLRYFQDKPLITSKLIDTGSHCETVFMGVKYTLPRKYNNFLFAVYLNYNEIPTDQVLDDDDSYEMNSYSFDIDNDNNTIYLKINKYLDFIDLIKGGKISNEPFIDLSFLYSVRQSYNTKSDLVLTFKSGGLLLCDNTIPTIINGTVTNDWKTTIDTEDGQKELICLKRSSLVNTSPLSDLIPQDGEVIFYVYSKYKNITYQSISLKLTGIQYVGTDYVWCEDISIKFFDTKKLLINDFENLEESELFKFSSDSELLNSDETYIEIDNSNIADSNFDNTILTVFVAGDNKTFKILNTKKVFSLKENYIERTRKVEYLSDGKKIITNNLFYFEEFSGDLVQWEERNFDFDETTPEQKITLFERNQLWYLLRSIISTELKFKNSTESQTIKIINELLLSNLYEFSNLNSIPINNSSEYIKLQVVANDFNIVIWNMKDIDNLIKTKICKICRYSGPNIPILDELKNLSDFQLLNHNKNQILNIFDKNYGNVIETKNSDSFFNIDNKLGYGKYHLDLIRDQTNTNDIINEQIKYDINSIGLWNEISGNIVSSLFIKTDDIITTIKNSNTNTYNATNLFKTTTDQINNITVNQNILEQLIYNNLFPDKNQNHISKFNYNLDEYIYNSGIEWLLNNFYYLSEIIDKDNRKIKFNFEDNSKLIEIDSNNYQPNGTYKLIWKRK